MAALPDRAGIPPSEAVSLLGYAVPLWGAVVCVSTGLSTVLVAAHLLLTGPLYRRVARRLLEVSGHVVDVKVSSNIVKQQRELICYAVLVAVGWGMVPWYGFIIDQASMWSDFTITWNMGVYYSLQMAMYLHLIFMDVIDRCSFQGPEPMDVFSWIHHVVCLVLVLGTLIPGYLRPGSITFVMHDPSSLALKTARMLYIADWKSSSKIAFKIFAGLFFFLRLVFYPVLFFNSAIHHSKGKIPESMRTSLGSLLIVIMVMNCYFMYKIIAVVKREGKTKSSTTTTGSTSDKNKDE